MPVATTLTMQAPSGLFGQVQTSNGHTYNITAAGLITGVTFNDVVDLMGAGFTTQQLMGTLRLPASQLRNLNGSLPATAGTPAGAFGLTFTPGTVAQLVSQAANNGTVTNSFSAQFTLPPSYVAGYPMTLDVNADFLIGSGTLSVKSLVMTAYEVAPSGVNSADIVSSGGTITLTGTATDYYTVLTPTSLAPGDILMVKGVMTLVETATSNVFGHINSVALIG